ncbi:outer membrane beta-barrel protein [Flavihumibacter petaseus]|uniref:Uncharacterized protein n=1 Tax=Flavihumibacter petaseus NBRC 106054 TaxID=1220578 RepID=A0A0E9MV78_9BACT|nr:outer membrane beta-barrel protein [Flavihumibacter petaseus]GAO41378.1 hypothetical protein FPE01S_01_03900 [Flavihumibacter petaseus NBRC 106054]
MKKKLLLFLLMAACTGRTIAQEKSRKFTAQLEIGPSIPLGGFADHTSSENDWDYGAGNALTGFAANILLKYSWSEHWGTSLLLGYSQNAWDEAHMEDAIRKQYGNLVDARVSADNWKIFKAMPGLYYSIPLSPRRKFVLQPMVSAGISKADMPGYRYVYRPKDGNNTLPNWEYPNPGGETDPVMGGGAVMVGEQKMPVTFCYQFSLALDYAISKRFVLVMDAGYFSAHPENQMADHPVSLSSMNVLVGAGYRF